MKDDEGSEKKPESKQNINPSWFPSHSPFYDLESGLFFGTWYQKQSKTIPIGKGP